MLVPCVPRLAVVAIACWLPPPACGGCRVRAAGLGVQRARDPWALDFDKTYLDKVDIGYQIFVGSSADWCWTTSGTLTSSRNPLRHSLHPGVLGGDLPSNRDYLNGNCSPSDHCFEDLFVTTTCWKRCSALAVVLQRCINHLLDPEQSRCRNTDGTCRQDGYQVIPTTS